MYTKVINDDMMKHVLIKYQAHVPIRSNLVCSHCEYCTLSAICAVYFQINFHYVECQSLLLCNSSNLKVQVLETITCSHFLSLACTTLTITILVMYINVNIVRANTKPKTGQYHRQVKICNTLLCSELCCPVLSHI